MKTKAIFSSTLIVTLFISACSRQPSEVDKAEISKQILPCFTSVTAKVGGKEEGLFDSLAELTTSLADINPSSIEKKWKLISNDSVLLTIETKNTKYECTYSKEKDSNWMLSKVSRNSEEVFDAVKNKENTKKNEEARAAKEKAESEAYTSTWHEKEFSNAAHKYYEKPHEKATKHDFDAPSIKIECDPKGTTFQYGGASFSEKVVQVSFDGSPLESIQLTSSGLIGSKQKIGWLTDVYPDEKLDKKFRARLFSSKSVVIDGFTFKIDDLSQVPCR